MLNEILLSQNKQATNHVLRGCPIRCGTCNVHLWLTCYLNLNVKLLLPVITYNMQVYYLDDSVSLYKHAQ